MKKRVLAWVFVVLLIVIGIQMTRAQLTKADSEHRVFFPLILSPPKSPTPTITPRGRIATGESQSLAFYQREEIWGGKIELISGAVCDGGGCWLPVAPENGVVTSGVINPWDEEIPDEAQPWDPYLSTPSPTATPTPTVTSTPRGRIETGENQSLCFNPGEEIYGWKIKLSSGAVCDGGDCWLPVAPESGIVTSGVINPWPGEVPEGTEPWIP